MGIDIGDQSITTVNGRMSCCSRVFRRLVVWSPVIFPVKLLSSIMSEDEGELSFGPGLSELVAVVEQQMASSNPPLDGSGGGLDLPEILMATSHCCQFTSRVSSANIVGLSDLLDVVLSQEFGKF